MSDDDDLFNEPTDDEENSGIKELRARADQAAKLEKQLKKLSEETEELRQFKQDQEGKVRVSSAEKAFEEAGLPTGLAGLFAEKHEGEISVEAVKTWGEGVGLSPKPEPTEETPATPQFTPTVAGQPPSTKTLTKAELDELLRTNPAAGFEAMDKGRVDFNAR